jgi:hypothetical protein
VQLSPSIFKAYDIRGIIDETLDPSIAKLIGQAFGTEMRELGETEIVIGRDGEKLKEIGQRARLDLEKLFGSKVFLELWVKVKGGWADDERVLKSLGHEF